MTPNYKPGDLFRVNTSANTILIGKILPLVRIEIDKSSGLVFYLDVSTILTDREVWGFAGFRVTYLGRIDSTNRDHLYKTIDLVQI